jgi:hypothetical protein
MHENVPEFKKFNITTIRIVFRETSKQISIEQLLLQYLVYKNDKEFQENHPWDLWEKYFNMADHGTGQKNWDLWGKILQYNGPWDR